jgi:hypothetical protein
MNISEVICKESSHLPVSLANEVLDFIQFIKIKHKLQDSYIANLKAAQDPVMNHLWGNDGDEVWNVM